MLRFASVSTALLCFVLLTGCGPAAKKTPKAETPNVSVAPGETTTAGKAAGPIDVGLQPDAAYPIPDVGPPELWNYINQLATMQPRGATDDQFIADQVSRSKSRLIAADRIILDERTDPDLQTAAVRAKLDALKMLALLDPQELGRHFSEYIDALNEESTPEFARMGRISGFRFEVDKLRFGQANDPKGVMATLKGLLAEEDAGEAIFLATQDAGVVLNDRGFADQCTEVLKLIGQRFSDHAVLGKEAQELLRQTEFRERVIAAMSGQRSDIDTLFTAINGLLSEQGRLNLSTLDNTLNAAQVLEFNGHFDDAAKVFQAIQKAFSKATDKSLAKQAELSVGFAQKRLGMVGHDIEIEGTQIDGKPFHWETYKGKVVLVDFWASTSAPWRSNLPSVKAAYDRFHEAGFEVVGVNVDQIREEAYEYLKRERLPWPTIIDQIAPGLDANPNAIRYGIQAVPFVMLVGRDGKVSDIHVRGAALSKRVEELLNQPSGESARNNEAILK